MIFHSLDFLIFLSAILAVYWRLPHQAQQLLLLGGSYFSYGYIHPWFLGLILITTATDFLAGLGMERFPENKRTWLLASILTNLGLLGFFKYFGFFVENVNVILETLGFSGFHLTLNILFPVGISFYTFQSMSYSIDIYRGQLTACRNPVDFALYISFFPQLVAGPIERAGRLLAQVQTPRKFSVKNIQDGLLLMVWGFFKKLVIADNLAPMVNNIFLLQSPPFWVLWAGTFAFTIQIFADFSAYTDIARGTAKLLGFQLRENFNHPYLAHSPPDFWKRWHISLSEWIRDYIYIPLGGARLGSGRTVVNLLVTFFLSGLWHGASWNYVLWGLWHGLLLVAHRIIHQLKIGKGLADFPGAMILKRLITFCLVVIGLLIFREQNLAQLTLDLSLSPWDDSSEEIGFALFIFGKSLILSLPLWLHALVDFKLADWIQSRPVLFEIMRILLSVGLFSGILALRSEALVDFIYFQF